MKAFVTSHSPEGVREQVVRSSRDDPSGGNDVTSTSLHTPTLLISIHLLLLLLSSLSIIQFKDGCLLCIISLYDDAPEGVREQVVRSSREDPSGGNDVTSASLHTI